MHRPIIRIQFTISAAGDLLPESGKKTLDEAAEALLIDSEFQGELQDYFFASSPPLCCVVAWDGENNIPSLPPAIPNEKIHAFTVLGQKIQQAEFSEFLLRLKNDHAIQEIHCLGGTRLVKELAACGMIDQIDLTWNGNQLNGQSSSSGITGKLGDFLPSSRHFKLIHYEPRPHRNYCFLRYQQESH